MGREREAQKALASLEEEGEKLLRSDRRFDFFAAFPTGVPFHQNMEVLTTVKAYSAVAMAERGLGRLESMERALKKLRQYSIDAQWVELICGDARE